MTARGIATFVLSTSFAIARLRSKDNDASNEGNESIDVIAAISEVEKFPWEASPIEEKEEKVEKNDEIVYSNNAAMEMNFLMTQSWALGSNHLRDCPCC